jgi:hypothetical protein
MAISSIELDAKIYQAVATAEAELLKEIDEETPAKVEDKPTESSTTPATEEESPSLTPTTKPTTTSKAETAKTPEQMEKEKKVLEVLGKYGAKKGLSWGEKIGLMVTGAVIGGVGYFIGHEAALLAYGVGGFLAFGGLIADVRRLRANSKKGEAVVYPAEVLKALLELVTLTPEERRYAELMVVLAQDPCPVDEETRKNLIQQANGMLDDYRSLEKKRAGITADLSRESIAAMEVERERLRAEAQTSDDEIVRQTKTKSAELLSHRIEDAEAVLRMAERMHAQQEAIYEAFGTLRSSLLRLAAAPSRLNEAAVRPLWETIEQTRQQTVLVEQAVQEVVALTGEHGG